MARTVRRMVVLGVLLFAVVVTLTLFTRGGNYRVSAVFESAGQLVSGADVAVGGKRIGTIESITLTPNYQARVAMNITNQELAPFHQGTRATIRLASLAGVASRYVSIQPGPNSERMIPDGGVLQADHTEAPVDLDQLIDSLDDDALQSLRNVVRGSAAQISDNPDTPINEPAYANQALRDLSPALNAGARFAGELAGDEQALADFIRESSALVATVAERRDDLAGFVNNASVATRAAASESDKIEQAFAALPEALKIGNHTLANLRTTLDDVQKLIDAAGPATRDLAPLMKDLRPLLDRAGPTFEDLALLFDKSGKNNDFQDLLSTQPKLSGQTKGAFPRAIETLKLGQPVIEFIRPYTPEFTAWVTHFGQLAGNYDANGHYARVEPTFAGFSTLPRPGYLTPVDDRMAEYPKAKVRRCPGSAIQTGQDGSNPFLDGGVDCDPSAVLPGP